MDAAYRYRAYCERVVDGDTLQLRIDLGFHIATTVPVRLYGVNAPELRTPAGQAAKEFLDALLHPAILFWENGGPEPLVVRSYRDRRSFARWVCEVWILETGQSLAEALIAAGHAEVFDARS